MWKSSIARVGFATSASAIQVAQLAPRQRIAIARCDTGRGGVVFMLAHVFGLSLIRCVLLWYVQLLTLVTQLGWGDSIFLWWPHGWGVMAAPAGSAVLLGVCFVRHICWHPLEFVQRRFLYIDAVSCHPNCLVLSEPRKHREEVDVGVCKHACPQVGVLGLGPIIVCEDVTQRAPLGGHQPKCRFGGCRGLGSRAPQGLSPVFWSAFSISFAALCEFADDGASLVSTFGQPNLSLLLKGDDSLADFERLQETRFCQVGKKRRWGQPFSAKCFPNQAGITGCTRSLNSHCWTSANPLPVSWVEGH